MLRTCDRCFVYEKLLLLVFHGSHRTGEKFRAFSGNVFDELAQEHGVVVVYPDRYKGHWNDARLSSNFPTRKAVKVGIKLLISLQLLC